MSEVINTIMYPTNFMMPDERETGDRNHLIAEHYLCFDLVSNSFEIIDTSQSYAISAMLPGGSKSRSGNVNHRFHPSFLVISAPAALPDGGCTGL